MPILLAFTSGLMIKRLEEREGIAVLSIEEGLEQLSGLGCIQAVAQSLHIVPGGEFHRLVSQARGYELKEADREEGLRISIMTRVVRKLMAEVSRLTRVWSRA